MKRKSQEQAHLDMLHTTKKAFIDHAVVLQESIKNDEEQKKQEAEDEEIMKLVANPISREALMMTFRGLTKDMKYKYLFDICSDNKLLHYQNNILIKRNTSFKKEIKDLEDTNSHLNEMFDDMTDDENETKKKNEKRIVSLRNKCKQKNEMINRLRYILFIQFSIMVLAPAILWMIH